MYCEETGNLYVHHDISLPSLPLCLAWMDMPPRTAAMSTASGSADEGHTVGQVAFFSSGAWAFFFGGGGNRLGRRERVQSGAGRMHLSKNAETEAQGV